MDDQEIVALYWARSEEALVRTAEKYGTFCRSLIRRILGDSRDVEECLEDTWLGAWNAMPPRRPRLLPPFLGRIARNTALDRYDYNAAQCRRGGLPAVLEELAECVGGTPVEEEIALRQLGEAIGGYLDTVSPAVRQVFLRRYFYCDAVAEIAERGGYSREKVKSMLHRARKGLRAYLVKEGYDL